MNTGEATLIELATAKFPKLTDAHKKLLQSIANGDFLIITRRTRTTGALPARFPQTSFVGCVSIPTPSIILIPRESGSIPPRSRAY
jgi:hypothetical protein